MKAFIKVTSQLLQLVMPRDREISRTRVEIRGSRLIFSSLEASINSENISRFSIPNETMLEKVQILLKTNQKY